jgi:hypothetical protein
MQSWVSSIIVQAEQYEVSQCTVIAHIGCDSHMVAAVAQLCSQCQLRIAKTDAVVLVLTLQALLSLVAVTLYKWCYALSYACELSVLAQLDGVANFYSITIAVFLYYCNCCYLCYSNWCQAEW